MLIVEGPDGSGKTTLITRIRDELGVEIRPRACTSDNGVDPATLRDWVDQDLSDPATYHGLYDRYPLISEPIYGPIIRGRMADGFADVEWMGSRLAILQRRISSLVVFCLPPWEVVGANIYKTHKATTEHLTGVLQKGQAIYDQYAHITASWAGEKIFWDYTDKTEHIEWVLNTVRGFAHR